jgi:hypothetical protein
MRHTFFTINHRRSNVPKTMVNERVYWKPTSNNLIDVSALPVATSRPSGLKRAQRAMFCNDNATPKNTLSVSKSTVPAI